MHTLAITGTQSLDERTRLPTQPHPSWAGCNSRRLAFFRRMLTALLLLTQAPVLVLSHSVSPSAHSIRTMCAVVWLCLLLPLARVQYVEWRYRQFLESLRTGTHGA